MKQHGPAACVFVLALGCGQDPAATPETDGEDGSAGPGPSSATGSTEGTTASSGAETEADADASTGSTGEPACSIDIDVAEALDDAICPPETSRADRLEACLCDFMPEVLEPADRPLEATDLLYYVNRWYSIDPCFPFAPDPVVLDDVRATYINQVGDLEPELLTQCGTYQDDLIVLPLGQSDDGDELRVVAWESAAPDGYPTTLDDLDVGWMGTVGFRPMFAAAMAEADLELYVVSGFRSLERQAELFEYYADLEGDPAIAAVYSAWPAHSEHQLGTTADVGIIEDGVMLDPFAPLEADLHATEAFEWIRTNAHRFGIVTTYQPDRVHVHQYKPEPWHLRFVGVRAADVMHACELSTEEFLAYRYERNALPSYPEIDLVYDAQEAGGWNPDTCMD